MWKSAKLKDRVGTAGVAVVVVGFQILESLTLTAAGVTLTCVKVVVFPFSVLSAIADPENWDPPS